MALCCSGLGVRAGGPWDRKGRTPSATEPRSAQLASPRRRRCRRRRRRTQLLILSLVRVPGVPVRLTRCYTSNTPQHVLFPSDLRPGERARQQRDRPSCLHAYYGAAAGMRASSQVGWLGRGACLPTRALHHLEGDAALYMTPDEVPPRSTSSVPRRWLTGPPARSALGSLESDHEPMPVCEAPDPPGSSPSPCLQCRVCPRLMASQGREVT